MTDKTDENVDQTPEVQEETPAEATEEAPVEESAEPVETTEKPAPAEETPAETTEEVPANQASEAAPEEQAAPQAAPAPASTNGYTDQPLQCRECGSDFVWTAGEQEFYAQKGFDNPPVRCPNCRQLKKQRQSQDRGGRRGGQRQSYPITCSKCGKQDTVPFMPKGDQPLLCWDCFKGNR